MTTEPVAEDAQPSEPEREWWEEPGMPWRHKPTRSDIACLSWIGAISVYSLVMLPLRPVMLTLSPFVLGSLGYRTGLVMSGALAATGDQWWPLVLFLGSLGAIKFDWIYWWAGKLWGHGLIDVWSGKSERARRRNERAINFAHRYESLAIFVTFLPIPLPAGVIYAALGAAGTTLRKFLTVGFLSSLVTTSAYVYLGYRIGEPAVRLIEQYGQWLWYLSIAILVGVIAGAWWKQRRG
ncbi:MAG: VTT domain-containing protein [Micropruina sp.]|nr:VTT domain-containing protein [Micropruina sp.]